MRARMSDPDKRERWLSYMETHYTATVEETGVTPEDWVLNMACGEARSILADVEDRAMGMAGHRPTRGDMGAAGCALRDCLAVFIGQTFPGEVC